MVIGITGSSGFLGRELVSYYEGKHRLILIQRSVVENKNFRFQSKIIPFNFLTDKLFVLSEALKGCDILFHCAYSLSFPPELPLNLLKCYQDANTNGKFVYFSSINTLIPALTEDPYTKSKIDAEKALFNIEPKIPSFIVRPSFVISPTSPGNLAPLVRLARWIGLIPILVPGPAHYFLPTQFLLTILDEELKRFHDNTFKCINITGKELVCLSEFIKEVFYHRKSHVLLVPIPSKLVRDIVAFFPLKPYFIKKKMKIFNDTVYSIPENIPKVISDISIRSMEFHY